MADPELSPLKLCRKCGQQKLATKEFFKTARSGNLTSPCRRCQLDHAARAHAANPEPMRKRARDWYAENRERGIESRRSHYLNNQDRYRKRFQEYYGRNVAAAVARATRWRNANRERWRELRSAWLSDPNNKARWNLQRLVSAHKRRAQKLASETQFTGADVTAMFAAQKGRCWWCSKGTYPLRIRD